MHISKAELTVGLVNVLVLNGITEVEQLLKLNSVELLSLHGLGMTRLKEVESMRTYLKKLVKGVS